MFPWNPGISWGACNEQSAELSEYLSEWEAQISGNNYCKLQKVAMRKASLPHHHLCAPPACLTKPPAAWSGAHWGSPLQAFCFVPSSVWKLSLSLSPLELRTQWWKAEVLLWCLEAGSWHMWHSAWDEVDGRFQGWVRAGKETTQLLSRETTNPMRPFKCKPQHPEH